MDGYMVIEWARLNGEARARIRWCDYSEPEGCWWAWAGITTGWMDMLMFRNIKLLKMFFEDVFCTHSEAEEACLVPPFPGDCCPAGDEIAAGLGRKPAACCLGGYRFVPVFKADILHQITVLTLLLLQCLWKYEANVAKPSTCWSWGFSLAVFFLGTDLSGSKNLIPLIERKEWLNFGGKVLIFLEFPAWLLQVTEAFILWACRKHLGSCQICGVLFF